MNNITQQLHKGDQPLPQSAQTQSSSWKKLLNGCISKPEQLAPLFPLNQQEIKDVCTQYPVLINKYYLSLIKDIDDPLYKQAVPSILELQDQFGEDDPLHEEPEHQARKGVPALITHRYPDRALFRVSNSCAMYCRFCTRKRKVGDEAKQPTMKQMTLALDYLREHEEIRDVIISGGDPFMLPDDALDRILGEVHAILKNRKFGIIRIGTRMPCTLPQRVTPELCAILKKYHPLYINTHFNHPREITPESAKACGMLADAGIPVGCQTVLLKGVNDDAEVMKELMQALVSIRVKPYYLYQADPIKGTNHLRTRVEDGLKIYSQLRGHTSGLCVPTFVIDAPSGGGKIPVLPDYVKVIGDEVVMENYEGRTCVYPQVKKVDEKSFQ